MEMTKKTYLFVFSVVFVGTTLAGPDFVLPPHHIRSGQLESGKAQHIPRDAAAETKDTERLAYMGKKADLDQ